MNHKCGKKGKKIQEANVRQEGKLWRTDGEKIKRNVEGEERKLGTISEERRRGRRGRRQILGKKGNS